MTKALSSLFIIFVFSNSTYSQINIGFVKHLENTGLKTEHQAYLEKLGDNDSAHYLRTRYQLIYFDAPKFLQQFTVNSSVAKKDPDFLTEASLKFLTADDISKKAWFGTCLDSSVTGPALFLKKMYSISLDPKKYEARDLPPELESTFMAYRSVSRKKPVVAAFLSAVIPGSGKCYAGKWRSGMMAFLINAGYAVQTYESSVKLGRTHPFTVINAGLFTVFYVVNIYGSVQGIFEQRKQRQKQFLADAIYYYH